MNENITALGNKRACAWTGLNEVGLTNVNGMKIFRAHSLELLDWFWVGCRVSASVQGFGEVL